MHIFFRGGVYTWTEANAAPCLPHRFRLWVQGRDSDSGQESWELDTPLEGVDLTQEQYQRHRAPAPRDLEIVETLYSLVVSWAPAPCVQVTQRLITIIMAHMTFSGIFSVLQKGSVQHLANRQSRSH